MTREYSVDFSKDGYKILNITVGNRGFNIGSKYNESREIKRFIESVGDSTEHDNYIVIGLGCGNHVKELFKNRKFSESKILVIDADNQWIETYKELGMYYNKEIQITSNCNDVNKFLVDNINYSNVNYLKVVSYGGYEKQFSSEILPMIKCIKEHIIETQINNNTVNNFEDTWYENKIKNLEFLPSCTSLVAYKDLYKNKPAVIVSAGPSLGKNIGLLKEHRDKALIISGGRTLKALLNIDVDPDFLAIVDAGKPSVKLVEDYIDKTKSNFVFYYGVPNEIVKKHTGNKIFFEHKGILDSIYEEEIIDLACGGSVAHSMTKLAVELGCNPIIFIGQDLAYTNDKEHAQIAGSPWKDNDVRAVKNEDNIWVKDINGNSVRTSITLDMFRRQLERIIKQNPNNEFINATEGGSNIEGTVVMSLSDVYEKIISKSLLINKDDKINLKKEVDIKKKYEDNIKSMRKAIELYTKAIKLVDKYFDMVSNNNKDTYAIESKLSKLERQILINNKDILFIETLVNKIIHELNNNPDYVMVESESDKESMLKALKKSKYIYISMKSKLQESIVIVSEILNKLEGN